MQEMSSCHAVRDCSPLSSQLRSPLQHSAHAAARTASWPGTQLLRLGWIWTALWQLWWLPPGQKMSMSIF